MKLSVKVQLPILSKKFFSTYFLDPFFYLKVCGPSRTYLGAHSQGQAPIFRLPQEAARQLSVGPVTAGFL